MKFRNSIECYITRPGEDRNMEVLLLHKPETMRHPAFWQPVTGGIEKSEKPMEACIREIKEETDLEVTLKSLRDLNFKFEINLIEDSITIRKSLFMCHLLDRERQIKISDEHNGFMWVNLSDVKNYLFWDSNKSTFNKLYSILCDTL